MERVNIDLQNFFGRNVRRQYAHRINHLFNKNVILNSEGLNSLEFNNAEIKLPYYPNGGLDFRDNLNQPFKILVFRNCSFKTDYKNVFNRNFIENRAHASVIFDHCDAQLLTATGFKSLTIINCDFSDLHLTKNERIELTNNQFESIKLESCGIVNSLNFDNCEAKIISLSDIHIQKNLKLNNLEASIILNKVTTPSSISFKRISFKGDSSLENIKSGSCSIGNCTGELLAIDHSEFTDLHLFRNQNSFDIQGSTILNGKVNLNKNVKLNFDNLSITEALLLDKNYESQLSINHTDITNFQLTENKGNLSISNCIGTSFPDLYTNSFSEIEIGNTIQEKKEWEIRAANCLHLKLTNNTLKKLVIQAIEVEEFSLKDGSGELLIDIDKVSQFAIEELRSEEGCEIKLHTSAIINISKFNSPSLDIRLDSNSQFQLQESQTQFEFKSNSCKTLSVTNLLEGLKSNIEVDKAHQINLVNFNAEQLKVTGRLIRGLAISDCDASLIAHIKESDSLTIQKYNEEHSVELKYQFINSIYVHSSAFKLFTLSTKECKSINLSSVKTQKLTILDSECKDLALKNLKTNSLSLSNIKSKELELTVIDQDEKIKIQTLELNCSNLESIKIENYDFNTINLSELTSNNIKALNSSYENLRLKVCSVNWVGIGTEVELPSEQIESIWLFQNLPASKLEVIESDKIESLIIKSEITIPYPEEIPISVILRQSSFDQVHISTCLVKMFSSEQCKFKNLYFGQDQLLTQISELVSQQDEITLMTLSGVSGKMSISENSIDQLDIKVSNLGSLSITECENGFKTTKDGLRTTKTGLGSISISETKIPDLKVNSSDIKSLSINKMSPKTMKLSHLNIGYLSFKSFRKADDKFSTFELNSINKHSKLNASTLEFIDCNLSGLSFNSCYFSSFKELSVQESKLDEIKCTATTWPALVTSPKDESQHFEIREACRQLKLAMANHHDKVSELQFHALEMNAYKSIVYSRWKNWRYWNDVLSLFAGSTNKFGLNWFRPIILVILTISMFYGALIWSHYDIKPFTDGYFTCWTPADYFQLYNPTHRLSQMSLQGDISGLTAFIDFLSKIASAFFIYQIVAAFRKFRRN